MNFNERMNLLFIGGSLAVSGGLTTIAANKAIGELIKVKINKDNYKAEIYNTFATTFVLFCGVVTSGIGLKGITAAFKK